MLNSEYFLFIVGKALFYISLKPPSLQKLLYSFNSSKKGWLVDLFIFILNARHQNVYFSLVHSY